MVKTLTCTSCLNGVKTFLSTKFGGGKKNKQTKNLIFFHSMLWQNYNPWFHNLEKKWKKIVYGDVAHYSMS
jgi:hypothetical protein